MDNKDLNSFLKMGYFLDYKNTQYDFDFSNIDKNKYNSYTGQELINAGSEILLEAITSRYEMGKKHVVPISGGLDSRAVLAGLLECTEAKNIETYTFGTPGTLDFEIGNYVAKKMGTKHYSYPLTEYSYSIEELLDISKRVDHQTVLFHHGPIHTIDKQHEGKVVWSGFLGDILTGDHLPKKNYSDCIEDAYMEYIRKNTYVKSMDLTREGIDFIGHIDFPNYNKKMITYEEQIDFMNRQLKYIAPHVLIKGYDYKTPFLDADWMEFIMSVDNKFRKNQILYKDILLNLFPSAFVHKTKTNSGLPLKASSFEIYCNRAKNKMKRLTKGKNLNINYIDFDHGIRYRDDLNKLVYENVMDLKNRQLLDWVDINKLWKDHINKKGDYSDALIVLTSLEIHLKAGKYAKEGV